MNAALSAEPPPPGPTDVPAGVRYARLAGRLLGAVLIALGIWGLAAWDGGGDAFARFRQGFFVLFGLLVNLPFPRLGHRAWRYAFGLLIAFSVAFVFLMIGTVMFDYMAAAERGERLGVPGFEGTLVFLALLQPPAVLFQRRPDLLD